MAREIISVEIAASCEAVFDVIHDYPSRLDWDSMLTKAYLLDGATSAGVGVSSVCTGTWRSLYLSFETKYIRFVPGDIAAVKLVNKPLFFKKFSATIRHDPLGENRSRTTYIYNFKARPKYLAWLIAPIINLRLKHEVSNRLQALKAHVER